MVSGEKFSILLILIIPCRVPNTQLNVNSMVEGLGTLVLKPDIVGSNLSFAISEIPGFGEVT